MMNLWRHLAMNKGILGGNHENLQIAVFDC